jgi:hypothetical protein
VKALEAVKIWDLHRLAVARDELLATSAYGRCGDFNYIDMAERVIFAWGTGKEGR